MRLRAAIDWLGRDGIVVSNHGGRLLDGAPAAITVLEEVVDAVGGRADVLLDGGIRRGTDIAKALALGATLCLVGRPYHYGLAPGERTGWGGSSTSSPLSSTEHWASGAVRPSESSTSRVRLSRPADLGETS